jgi:hypothetical protein
MSVDYFELYPYICVYTNLVDNPAEIYSIAQKISNYPDKNLCFKWSDWPVKGGGSFGTYGFANFGTDKNLPAIIPELESDSELSYDNTNYFEEVKIFQAIKNAREISLEHYIKKYNVELPKKNFISISINIAKYNTDFDIGLSNDGNIPNNKSMNYHTDYTKSHGDDRQTEFLITSNIYLNDDYEGGKILFDINGEQIDYKPKAGEVVVFPSGSPLFFPEGKKYMHAVETCYLKNKFLSRNYLMYEN